MGDAPDQQGGGNMNFWWPGSQPFLRVNAFGQRFCNEDGPYDVAFNLACMQPGHFWWQVFDDSSWEDVVAFDTTICSRVVAKEGAKNCLLLGQFYPCTSDEEWHSVYLDPNVENGVLIKADTLEGLADLMEFDEDTKATFLATVKRYNDLAAGGADLDHDKAPWRMTSLDAPPYYACKLTGWLLTTLSGIRVDGRYNALTSEGVPIPGLKMAGLDHGGFFSGMYAQYYGGLNMAHNLLAAWLGAKDIMGLEPPVALPGVQAAYQA
ncbi:MAG: FAD-binding protein [Coriobacteriales bacterium]|nr:FAD-binding protein [Coriobacteriales bacterium]